MLAACLIPLAAPAQELLTLPVLNDHLRQASPDADHLVFCINSGNLLAPLDREIAGLLGEALLISVTTHDLLQRDPSWPYDFGLAGDETWVASQVLNHCDVLMGYPYPAFDPVPNWLSLTRPYMAGAFDLVTAQAGLRDWSDLPPTAVIGSRIEANETFFLRESLRQHSATWRPYAENESLFNDIAEGKIEAGLIWRPALVALNAGHSAPLQPITAGPQVPVQNFGLAVMANHAMLRVMLDDAIAYLLEEGLLDAAFARYGITTP